MHTQAVARRLCVGLAASFFGGWVLFPVGFTLGPNLTKSISDRQEHVFFFLGDLLSKNVYVVVMIFFKHWFLRTLDAHATSDPTRSSNNGELPPGVRAGRRPSQIIVQEMTDGFPGDARRIDFANGRTATPTPVVPPVPTQLDAVTLRTIIPPENMLSSYGGVSRRDSIEASALRCGPSRAQRRPHPPLPFRLGCPPQAAARSRCVRLQTNTTPRRPLSAPQSAWRRMRTTSRRDK